MNRNGWKIFLIVILLAINGVLLTVMYNKISGTSKPNQSVTVQTEKIVPEVKNTISVSGNKINIQANTTLSEGTKVKYNLWLLDKYQVKSNIERVVAVQNKVLSCVIDLGTTLPAQEMTLNTEVLFNNMDQPDHVKKIYGDKGEYLTGNHVKSLGEYNALLFQDKFTYPDEKTYKASMTPDKQIEEAISKAVAGLSGIEIYKKNGRYAVEANYTLADVIGLRSAAEKVARDFTFAAYATGLPIARTSIIINKPDGKPGLIVTVGNNQASTQSESTWTDSSIGPTVFMDWVKKNTNQDYKNIENHTTVKYNF